MWSLSFLYALSFFLSCFAFANFVWSCISKYHSLSDFLCAFNLFVLHHCDEMVGFHLFVAFSHWIFWKNTSFLPNTFVQVHSLSFGVCRWEHISILIVETQLQLESTINKHNIIVITIWSKGCILKEIVNTNMHFFSDMYLETTRKIWGGDDPLIYIIHGALICTWWHASY